MTAAPPELSLVMPCYNEEEVIGYTIPQLLEAFRASPHVLELVAVDNGSSDGTARLLAELAEANPEVVVHTVATNIGYGNGILEGFTRATAPWVGTLCADGQVDAEDVVRLFDAVRTSSTPVVGKVRRRFRMDGFRRKITSVVYNGFVVGLWPGIGSIDINGVPKMTRREVLDAMQLESRQWFLDPELMIKAHLLGVRVLEMNVFSRMRGNGLSHVRASTCWEFFRDLCRYRFGGALTEWRKQARSVHLDPLNEPSST